MLFLSTADVLDDAYEFIYHAATWRKRLFANDEIRIILLDSFRQVAIIALNELEWVVLVALVNCRDQQSNKVHNKSHARTVVRECCKGDDESQWERVKFDPPPPKNHLTDGHQNLRT